MTILLYNQWPLLYRIVAVLLITVGSCFVMTSGTLAVNGNGYDSVPRIPIAVSADELIGDESSKSAEFIGNVRVVRGEYTLTTDRLKIFFAELEKKTNEKNRTNVNIKEIIAVGHVRISSNELMARADRAIYDRKTRLFVLTG